MSRIAIATALALLVTTGASFAQVNTMQNGSNTTQAGVKNPQAMPGMAATSSGAGKLGTGASSAAIGTGNTETHGVMSPTVPGTTGNGATGANPSNPGGEPNNQ